MADALKVVRSNTAVKRDPRRKDKVAEGLVEVLADTYRLLLKTHAYHWNVEGPLFFAIHSLTEEQYRNMFAATDELAERVRALKKLVPHKFPETALRSGKEETQDDLSAVQMCKTLSNDHENLSNQLRELGELATARHDTVTASLVTERCRFHEKAAWMLRALARG